MNRKGFLESIGALFGAVVLAPVISKLQPLPITALTELMTAECHSNFEGDWHHYAATNDGRYYRDGIQVPKEKCIIEFRSPTSISFANTAFYDTEVDSFFNQVRIL